MLSIYFAFKRAVRFVRNAACMLDITVIKVTHWSVTYNAL